MKAFFTGRSERIGDSGSHVSQGPIRRKKSSSSRVGVAASDAGVSTTSSRRHRSGRNVYVDGEEEGRRSGADFYAGSRAGGSGSGGRLLTESAIRALDEREEDEWEDEDGRSERRRKSGEGERREKRRSEKGESVRGEKEKRDRDREGRREGKSYAGGGEKFSRSGKPRAQDPVDAPESSRAIPPMGSFDQFPGQYNDPIIGPPAQPPPSSRPDTYMSGALPPADPAHQFPQQIPAAFDRPPPTLGPTRADSFGAAADYYMDEGQSVQHQPGIRPWTPNMLHNPDTHLMSASVEAQPAQDTGHGSAADFYSGKVSPVPFNAPSKPGAGSSTRPSRPGRQSSGGSSKPSQMGMVAAGAAAAGLMGAASSGYSQQQQQQQQTTSYATSQSNGTGSRPPVKPTRHNTDPSIIGGQAVEYYGPSTPSKQNGSSSGKPPSSRPDTDSSNLPLYAAGAAAAGAAAYEYSHHHNQQQQSSSYNATSNSQYHSSHGPGSTYPPRPYTNGTDNMQQYHHFHEHRGPITRLKDGLLNLISDPDDVRRMEEYTEYIGVCKYCFDPRTTPSDGPRRHHYHRRPSEDSFEELRRRKSVEKMRRKGSSERIDKQSRYHSEKRSGGIGAGTGLAAAGLAAGAGAAMFASSGGKNFDDTYSVKSGHRASSAMRRRSRSSSREQRRKSTYGTVRPGSRDGRNGYAGAAMGAAALGGIAAAAAASSRRRSRSDSGRRRHSPNSAYYRTRRGSSSSRGSGGGGGFLSSFFSPSRNERKSRRRSRDGQAQHKRKKSRGFFSMAAGSESSSSDEDLVFGEANLSRTSLPLHRKNSGRTVRRRRSSEHMAATVAGIGATAAALAAAQRGRDHRITKRGSRPELGARRVEHVIGKDGRPRPQEEDSEWEDELPSEASSVMDEGLAFGEADGLRRRESRESVGDAWGWRWGGKGQVRRRRSQEGFEGAYDGAVGSGGPTYQESTRDSWGKVPQQPMQELDPRPFSESGSRHGSMPGSFDPGDVPVARPGPGPIQQPQPIAPVSPKVFDTTSASPEDRPRPRRTASSPTRPSGGFGLKDVALIGAGAVAAGSIIAGSSGRKSREGGSNVRFGLTEAQQAKEDRQRRKEREDAEEERRRNDRTRALKEEAERSAKEADACQREEEVRRRREEENRRAAEERAAAARREEERRQREDRERWEREQAEQRRQEDIRRARQEEVERQRAERARKDGELKEEIERKQKEVDEASRRRKQEAEERRKSERESVYAEDTTRRRSKQDSASDSPSCRSSSGWGAVAAGAMAAATAGAVLAGSEHSRSREKDSRREEEYEQYPEGQALYHPIADSKPILPDQITSGTPVMDDDLFDKDFFANRTRSRSPADYARQAEIARKAAEKVVRADQVIQDMDEYYNAPSVSQAEFFAPKDLLEQKSGGKTRVAEAVPADVQVFNARPEDEQMVRFDPQGRNRWAPYGVPKLQVISPTPPPASPLVTPARGGGEAKERERSKSPLSQVADVAAGAAVGAVAGSVVESVASGAAPAERSGNGRRERSRSITWGEDKTHVYDPPTPETFMEREKSDGSYMDARDVGPGAQDEIVVEREEPEGGKTRTAYKAEEPVKESSGDAVYGSYRTPFAESVSDVGLKGSEPADRGAELLSGFESNEPTTKRHIPGSFDDDEMEFPTPTPRDPEPDLEESPDSDPPLSKKEKKKKKAKAAAAAAAFNEPRAAFSPGLERVQTLPEDDQSPAETPKAIESPAAADDDYFTGGKKGKKKGKKAKAAASAWDEEPIRPGLDRVNTLPDNDNSPAESPVPEPSEQPTSTRDIQPEWEPPLSKKDKKKRAKAAAAAEAFGDDFGEPVRPGINRVNTLPDDDTTPAESPVPERSGQPTPAQEVEPEWEPPLSKKDKKRREKAAAAAAAAAAAFDDVFAESTRPGIDRVNTLPDDDQTPAESPVPEPLEEPTPVREVEPEWEPPLSKKDKKKRDKAAKAGAAFDAFDEPATERPGLDRVQTLPEDAETPVEEVPAEGFSSKKDKKKKKDKAADREASFAEEQSEPSKPTPLAQGESWADAVEGESFSAEPESMEPAAEGNADDYFMSKKDKKKRDKAAKRGVSESSLVEEEPPSTEVMASEADLPKLSKKEQKKRDKEAKKQGFADVAESMMTGASLVAMADATAKEASSEPEAESEEWSTGKKSKTSKKKGKDSDRDPPTEQSDSGDQAYATPSDPYDPFQYQIRESNSPLNEEAADYSTPKSKKKDKKKKRESGRFNEPAASSPLREEWNYDDYIGQTGQRDESKSVEQNGEEGVAVGEKREVSSSRRQSPDDGRARSVAFNDAVSDGERRRSTSRKARSEVGYADDRGYYDDNRSVAGSEPVGYYDKPSKRRSRHEDDDARSEVSSRSKRDKEDPPKKEKKSGIFGLFSRNKSSDNMSKSDEPAFSRTSTRDSNEDDGERRRKKKHRDSSAYDDDDARSTTSNRQSYNGDDTRERRRSSRYEDGDYDTRSEPGRKYRRSATYDDYGNDDDTASRADTEGGGRTRRSKRSGDDNDADQSFLGVRVEDLPPLPASDDESLDIEAPVEKSEQGHGTPVSAEIDETRALTAREEERSLALQGFPGVEELPALPESRPETPMLPEVEELPALPESRTVSPELPPGNAEPNMKDLPAIEGLPGLPVSRTASPRLPPQRAELDIQDLPKPEELPALPDSRAQSPSRAMAEPAVEDVVLADAGKAHEDVEHSIRTEEQNDDAVEAASRIPLPLSRAQSSPEPSQGEAERPLVATRDLSRTPVTEDLERPDFDDLPPLPRSPLEAAFETPDRPGLASRPVSTTAVPIKFPFGHARQRPERAASTSSTVLPSPSSPTSSHKRTPRPTSTEFRPLYLVERNTKPQEVEEVLPSLPSSKPSSRASSVHGSDDWHSAAEDPPSPERERLLTSPDRTRNLSIDTDRANTHQDPEYLDSAQTTPKATEFPHHVVDRPLRQQPQFYTWEDFEQDERLHSHEPAHAESLQMTPTHADERIANLAEVPQDLPPLPASGPPTPTEPAETPESAESHAQDLQSTPIEDVTEQEATQPKVEGMTPVERTPAHPEEQAKKPEGRLSWSAKGLAAAAFGFGSAFGRKISPFQQDKEAAKVNTDPDHSNESPPVSDLDEQSPTPPSEQTKDLPQEQSAESADLATPLLRTVSKMGKKGKGGKVKTISSIPPTPLGFAGEGDISNSPAPSAEPSAALVGPAPRAQDSYFPDLTSAVVEEEPPVLREVDSTAPASSAAATNNEKAETERRCAVHAEPREPVQADERLPALASVHGEADSQPSVPEEEAPAAPFLTRKQSKKAKKKQQRAAAWQDDDDQARETTPLAEETSSSADAFGGPNIVPGESHGASEVGITPDSATLRNDESMPQDIAANQTVEEGGEDDFAGFSMSRKKSKKDKKKKARAAEATDPSFDSLPRLDPNAVEQESVMDEPAVGALETAETSKNDDDLGEPAVSRKKSKKDKKKKRQTESAWPDDENSQAGPTDAGDQAGETLPLDRRASQVEPTAVPLPETEDEQLLVPMPEQVSMGSGPEPVHPSVENGIRDREQDLEPGPADVPLPVADDKEFHDSVTPNFQRPDEIYDTNDLASRTGMNPDAQHWPYVSDASAAPLPQDADVGLNTHPTAPAMQFESGKLRPDGPEETASSLCVPSHVQGNVRDASFEVEPADMPLPASEDADLEVVDDPVSKAKEDTSTPRDGQEKLPEVKDPTVEGASADPSEEFWMPTSKKGKKSKKARKALEESSKAATPPQDTQGDNVITQAEPDAEVAARDVTPPSEAEESIWDAPKKKGKKQTKTAEDATPPDTGDREIAIATNEPLPAESQPDGQLQSLDTPQAAEADEFWAPKKKGKKGRNSTKAELAKEDESTTDPTGTREVPAEEHTQEQAALSYEPPEPEEPVVDPEAGDIWAPTKKSKKGKKAVKRAAQSALDDPATPADGSALDDGLMALATPSNRNTPTPIEPAETRQETEIEDFWAPTKKDKKSKKASKLAAQARSNDLAELDRERDVRPAGPSNAPTEATSTPIEAAETPQETEAEEFWAAPKQKGKKGKKAARLEQSFTPETPDLVTANAAAGEPRDLGEAAKEAAEGVWKAPMESSTRAAKADDEPANDGYEDPVTNFDAAVVANPDTITAGDKEGEELDEAIPEDVTKQVPRDDEFGNPPEETSVPPRTEAIENIQTGAQPLTSEKLDNESRVLTNPVEGTAEDPWTPPKKKGKKGKKAQSRLVEADSSTDPDITSAVAEPSIDETEQSQPNAVLALPYEELKGFESSSLPIEEADPVPETAEAEDVWQPTQKKGKKGKKGKKSTFTSFDFEDSPTAASDEASRSAKASDVAPSADASVIPESGYQSLHETAGGPSTSQLDEAAGEIVQEQDDVRPSENLANATLTSEYTAEANASTYSAPPEQVPHAKDLVAQASGLLDLETSLAGDADEQWGSKKKKKAKKAKRTDADFEPEPSSTPLETLEASRDLVGTSAEDPATQPLPGSAPELDPESDGFAAPKRGKKGKKPKASRQSSWMEELASTNETTAALETPADTEDAVPLHHEDAVGAPLDLAADSVIPPLNVDNGTREHARPTIESPVEVPPPESYRPDREARSEVAPDTNEREALPIERTDEGHTPEALQQTAIDDDDAAFTPRKGKKKGKKSRTTAEDRVEERMETVEGSEADHGTGLLGTALGAVAGAAAVATAYGAADEEPSDTRGPRGFEPKMEGMTQDSTMPAAAENSAQEAEAEEFSALQSKRSKKDKKKAKEGVTFDLLPESPAGEPMETDVQPSVAPTRDLQGPIADDNARDVPPEFPATSNEPAATDGEFIAAPLKRSKKDRRKAKKAGAEWDEPAEEAISLDPPDQPEESAAETATSSAAKPVDKAQETAAQQTQPAQAVAESQALESADLSVPHAQPAEEDDWTGPSKRSKKEKRKAKKSADLWDEEEEPSQDVSENSAVRESTLPEGPGHDLPTTLPEEAFEPASGKGATRAATSQESEWPDFTSKKSKKDQKKAKRSGLSTPAFEDPEPLAEPQSTQQSRDVNDDEDKLPVAAPTEAEAITADERDSQDRPTADETPTPSQESEWPEFTTKKSKKDKKKAKKGGAAAPALEDPDTAEAKTTPSGGFDESMDGGTFVDPSIRTAQAPDADPRVEDEQPDHAQVQAEPGHVPSVAAHSGHDVDFAATLAAGLADSGFDPDLVVDHPFYHRRASPPASVGEGVPDEAAFSFSKRKKNGKKGRQSQIAEPDVDEESKQTSAKDTSATDTDFDADVTQGLQASGFDPALLQQAMASSQGDAKDIPGGGDFVFTSSKKRKGKKGKDKAAPSESWQEPVTSLDEAAAATPEPDKTLEDTVLSPLAVQSSGMPPNVDDKTPERIENSDGKEESTPMESNRQITSDSLDPAHTFNVGGDKELDVEEMDDAYSAFKRKERRKSKKKRNVAFDEPTPEQSEPVSEPERNAPGPVQPALAVQPVQERDADYLHDVAVEEAPPEPESPSKVRNIFPGLERVKRRKSSASAAWEPQLSSPHYGKTGPPGLLHTSEISQSLPRPVGVERAMPQDSARDRHAGPSPPVGWSFDALDNATPIEDSPSVSTKPHEVIRDSGYQEVSTPTSNRHSGERAFSPLPEVRSRPSRDSLHSRRSAEPLHIDTGNTPDWRLSVGKSRSAAESLKRDDGGIRSTSNGSVAETPLESTTKNRASYLFQATPLNSKESATPTTSDQRRRRDDYFAEREIQSEESPTPMHHGSAERGAFSPPPTGPLSPRAPLDAIPEEHGNAQSSKRKSEVSEAAAVKSPRHSDQPHSLRSARERTLSPTSRTLGLVAGQRSSSIPLSTDELINSLDWPAVNEARDTVNIDRSLRRSTLTESVRSPSVMSNHSNVSANPQFRSPIDARSFSRASNRSSTPTLRRIDRSLSGDLRAASRRGETGSAVGARSSPKTIPFEPPPTPPPNDEDVIVAGAAAAAGAAVMADVFSGYGDGHGSQVSPTRPPSVRKRQSMHIVDLESRLDALTAENRALQEARMEAEQSREAFATAPGVNAQEALQRAELRIREKDAEINRINALIGPLQEELEHLREINAGLTEANRNLVDDTNGRYATLQAEHANAHEQWQNASRELEQMRSQHGQFTESMRATIEQQVANALADKNAEILRLREELDIASERIRALQVQIQSSKTKDFLTIRDEDYFDGACQKLCQHVQQWVLRFSKLSDNRICRLSTELRSDKIEAALDNAILDGSDVDKLLGDRVRRRDVFMSVVMTMIWEYVFTRYLFGMDREQRQKLKALEKVLAEVGPPRAIAQWRATTLTLLSKRPEFSKQCAMDTEAVAREVFDLLRAILPPPSNAEAQLMASLIKVVGIAADLAIEMRTQRAEYIMLPPLQPEYDSNGDLVRQVHFNASLMNERSGMFSSNEELEQERAVVKIVLFPLVVKKGDEFGEGEEEIVVCPAQVLVQNEGQGRREGKKVVRVLSGAMEIEDPRRASRQSVISTAPGSVAF